MISWIKHTILSSFRNFKRRQKIKQLFPTVRLGNDIEMIGPLENLQLGKNVIIQSKVFIDLGGEEWCEGKGSLKIGDEACISPGTIIYAGGAGGVTIGNHFDCGPGARIFSSRTDYAAKEKHIFAPVSIGHDVVLFSNVVISPGVTIGDGACIAAGAVVTQDIPAGWLAGGIPAIPIKKIVNK